MIKHPITQAAIILAFFGMLGAGLVTLTHHLTDQKIQDNQRQALLASLYALVPNNSIDNPIDTSIVLLNSPTLLGSESTAVYLGFKQLQPVAAVYNTRVSNGYNGEIQLLVAVKYNGSLAGVRVLTHKETPGLGDKIELKRSLWILGFDQKSLSNPNEKYWAVKRDGGEFDQFTGATITPRAIVGGVKKTLLYHRDFGQKLFSDFLKSTTQKGQTHAN